MPIKRYKDGTGLTKRDRVKVTFSKPPTAEEIEAVRQIFEQDFTFDGAIKPVEVYAVDLLRAAGLPEDGSAHVDEVQSPEWYANETLKELKTIRAVKERVAAGKGDEADALAKLALSLGMQIYEAMFKTLFERDTKLGITDREGRVKGAKVVKQSRSKRDAFIRRLANDHRREGKTSAREIAVHIENRARLEMKRAVEQGSEGEVAKLWAEICKLSPNRIRRIIAK